MITSSGTDVLIILFPKTSRVAAQGGLLFALFESVEGYIIPASGNEQPDNNLLKHLRRPPEVFLFFGARLATGRILCRPSYSFPASISPIDSTAIYDKSLYEAEESANKFETELIQAITGLPNIRWWHRNIVRTGFAINGFINHYPDFIVRTRSGKIVIIETKGDHLANEETLAKLHLGRAWQEQAGPGDRYFLVFQDKDISMTGVYPMSEFLKILAEL